MKKRDLLKELLESWEETYKKGQLSLWVFLALKEGEKYVDEIKEFIEKNSNGAMTCEEQSLYRNMRKFEHLEMVTHTTGKGHKGPERKYYYLTELGEELLALFIDRNIKLFYTNPIIINLLK